MLLVAPWGGEDFAVLETTNLEAVNVVRGHQEEPKEACWFDNGTKAITSSDYHKAEMLCWDTSNWTRLYKVTRPSTIVHSPHGDFAGIIVGNTVRLGTNATVFNAEEEFEE